jgi:hypothetical protein
VVSAVIPRRRSRANCRRTPTTRANPHRASGIERPAAQRSLGLGRLERKVFYTVCTYTKCRLV